MTLREMLIAENAITPISVVRARFVAMDLAQASGACGRCAYRCKKDPEFIDPILIWPNGPFYCKVMERRIAKILEEIQ